MKKTLVLLAVTAMITACNKKEDTVAGHEPSNTTGEVAYQVFGDSLTKEGAISKEEMLAKYEAMKPGDTLSVKFNSEIISTCKKKGCWMTLNLASGKEAFVKFKDYAFFVPKEGAENHEAVVSGKAFIEETSVDQLKHEAKDAGKTQEEIDKITEPSKNYRFMADGVLIAEAK